MRRSATAGNDVTIEREAWMISGKVKFGGPIGLSAFSYMDAGDLEVSYGGATGGFSGDLERIQRLMPGMLECSTPCQQARNCV